MNRKKALFAYWLLVAVMSALSLVLLFGSKGEIEDHGLVDRIMAGTFFLICSIPFFFWSLLDIWAGPILMAVSIPVYFMATFLPIMALRQPSGKLTSKTLLILQAVIVGIHIAVGILLIYGYRGMLWPEV